MKRKIFIGGAWPYANYLMHVGHLAALLPGDVIARYYRKCGDEVIYVSGSDMHGTPITERAKKEGKTPLEISSFYHEEDVKTFNNYNFSYDLYTNTEDSFHKEEVKKIVSLLNENGYIYEKEELQDYCETCKCFLSDRELKGICPHCGSECNGDQCDNCLSSLECSEVKDKHCKTCGNKTVLKNNKHLYFKLSSFQDSIKELVDKNKDTWRRQAVGETLKFLEMGLIDRAITRQLEWGVEVPIEGYSDKRIYVWFEAVLGYITTCMQVCNKNGINFEEFITDKDLISYYVHGKDNIPFHTVIYPSLLMAMKKNYNLPNKIICSGYVNIGNEKMSKSKGNLITANDLIEKYDVDSVRYYMIANGPEKKDVVFSIDDYEQAHNKFLVGVLGNFINRNLSFIKKKFDGVVKEGKIDSNIVELTKDTYKKVSSLIEEGELKSAIELIMDYVSSGNKYYDENEPWNLAKNNLDKFYDVTYTCVYMMANISNLIDPFMPNTTGKINRILNITNNDYNEVTISGDIIIDELPLLFNRIEK